jgi:hypothetical protein
MMSNDQLFYCYVVFFIWKDIILRGPVFLDLKSKFPLNLKEKTYKQIKFRFFGWLYTQLVRYGTYV